VPTAAENAQNGLCFIPTYMYPIVSFTTATSIVRECRDQMGGVIL
jgi:hypothetical protein